MPKLRKRACLICSTMFWPSSASNVCCSRACQKENKGSFESRFWARVDKNGPVAAGQRTPCWLWTGRIERTGYARIKLESSRKQVSVHRLSWLLRHGPIPDGMLVLHRCDVRHCVRHLFLGTHEDNSQDMLRKGRGNKARGAEHGRSKLTEKKVLKLLELRRRGKTLEELAAMFGVGDMQVSRICRGLRWAHLQQG